MGDDNGEGLLQNVKLSARVVSRSGTNATVAVEWAPADAPLAEVLAALGRVPIPPYLRREPIAADTHQYQTVYARQEGRPPQLALIGRHCIIECV